MKDAVSSRWASTAKPATRASMWSLLSVVSLRSLSKTSALRSWWGHRAGGLQVMGDAAGRRVRLPLCLELIGTDSVQPRQCGQGPPPHVRVQLQSWQGSVQDLSCTSGHLGTARLTEQPRLPCCLQPGAGAYDLGVGSRRGSTEPAPPAGHGGRLPLRGGPGRVIGHEAFQERTTRVLVGVPAGDPQRLVSRTVRVLGSVSSSRAPELPGRTVPHR